MAYKVCDRCRQPAMLDATECKRCGLEFLPLDEEELTRKPRQRLKPVAVAALLGAGLLTLVLARFVLFRQEPAIGKWLIQSDQVELTSDGQMRIQHTIPPIVGITPAGSAPVQSMTLRWRSKGDGRIDVIAPVISTLGNEGLHLPIGDVILNNKIEGVVEEDGQLLKLSDPEHVVTLRRQ